MCVCVCACVCVRASVCVGVCVCVCMVAVSNNIPDCWRIGSCMCMHEHACLRAFMMHVILKRC